MDLPDDRNHLQVYVICVPYGSALTESNSPLSVGFLSFFNLYLLETPWTCIASRKISILNILNR